MGFLINVLTLPIMGPIKGIVWIAEKVVEQADRELYDEEAIRGRLMELELNYDLGKISEEEYLTIEEELLARLKVIRERRLAEGEE